MTYLMRRLLLGAAQILALSFMAFLLLSVAPGHFFSTEGLEPQRSGAAVDAWMRLHGLDQPWPKRYLAWLDSCVRGGCGTSLAYQLPVSQLISARAPRTMAVAAPAWLFGWMLGLGLALFCAARTRLRRAAETVAAAAGMLPEVLIGSLILWLAVSLGSTVTGARLPVLILTLPLAAVIFLHASDALASAQRMRFVQLARARGIPARTLWMRYVLPAAGNPLVSLLAPSLVGIAGSALAVEALTGWPGVGPLFLDAFRARDYPVVQAVLLILSTALTLLSLVGDLLLYRLDPRIRLDDEAAG